MNLRTLDRNFGPLMLQGLGVFRSRRHVPADINRIGFLKTRAIGDAILSSTMTKAAREIWPAARLVYFADESTAPIANLIPEVDEVWRASAVRPWKGISKMRRAKVDLLFDLGSWPRIDAVLTALAGARFTVGFNTDGQRRHFAYDLSVIHRSDVHEVDNYLALIRSLKPDFQPRDRYPSLQPGVTLEETSRRLGALDIDASYFVFHPWAGGANPGQREWPEQNWVDLGRRVLHEGHTIAISGAPTDARHAERLRERLLIAGGDTTRVINLAGMARLSDMYWVLQRAATVISVNTGIMHMAAATGAHVIGLHGPTNPKRWGPIGPRAVIVKPDDPDCGFLNLGFEYEGRKCDCMSKSRLISWRRYFCLRTGPGLRVLGRSRKLRPTDGQRVAEDCYRLPDGERLGFWPAGFQLELSVSA